jgi:hypothetical protein
MTQLYDESFKQLVNTSPEEFVQWLMPGAKVLNTLSNELIGDKLIADSVLEVIVKGQRMIQHIEFQKENDREMAERVLWYNVRIGKLHKLPVRSFVIYLYTNGQVPPAKLIKKVPTGHVVHKFYFVNIELSRLSPKSILQSGQLGLLPLLPFTRGGISREMILTMFNRLRGQPKSHDLATIAHMLASAVMKDKKSVNLEWLEELFKSMEHEFIRESPIYKMILQKGEGQGAEQALQKAIIVMVEERFPPLALQTKQYVATLHDLTLLLQLNTRMSIARTEQEARALLTPSAHDGNGNIGQA